ncbi:hypothetical protein [Actinoplanes auranticolor]|uniref:Uncharacterized protein n=1 Tax=Actinoplanes auranticolor TaxID=47988 RepID=A0A919SPF6_9ACTN|nr:hypothetical protein [Actinoplanes auranticolor]GIM75494.1 hypothetical protein Aau02nite_66210 [Actinoplanes auranticolor]
MTFYEPSRTIAGQVQRGLGRGAHEVRDAGTVYACVRSDFRWWWSIDERAVYLARLIRDLGLGVEPLTDRLHAADTDEENNEFTNTLEVLEVLGRAGVDGVVDEVRRYVAEGSRGREVLQVVSREWPVEHWEDLRRPPVDGPAAQKPAVPPGDQERETAGPDRWNRLLFAAAHGDESDVPLLLDGIAWLDARDDRCGYNRLVDGLARIGGPGTAGVPKLLRRLWFTPHSYERASYLRAYLMLDPDGAESGLREGLWDCERDVRLLAVQRVQLSSWIRERLVYLRDDPIEAPEVRAAAAARLTP